MTWSPRVTRTIDSAELQSLTLGLSMVDDYLQFMGTRSRPRTWLRPRRGVSHLVPGRSRGRDRGRRRCCVRPDQEHAPRRVVDHETRGGPQATRAAARLAHGRTLQARLRLGEQVARGLFGYIARSGSAGSGGGRRPSSA
jgi:hypothetical protein